MFGKAESATEINLGFTKKQEAYLDELLREKFVSDEQRSRALKNLLEQEARKTRKQIADSTKGLIFATVIVGSFALGFARRKPTIIVVTPRP